MQLVPGLEDLKDVRVAFAGFGCDGIVEPGVKRLVNLVNPGQSCPANNLLELLVEHPDALDPRKVTQGHRKRLPRAVEAIEDTEHLGDERKPRKLELLLTIELRPATVVDQIGLSPLPPVQVLLGTFLGNLDLGTGLVKLPFELTNLGARPGRHAGLGVLGIS